MKYPEACVQPDLRPRMLPAPTIPLRIVLSTVLALASGLSAYSQGSAALTVHVVLNEPDAGGTLRVALCPDKAAFDSEEGCTVLALEAVGHVITGTFTDLRSGPCAIKVFHDINRDGKLNTSWIGWPQEPYGFSNDAPVNMGPPPFKLAMITLKEGPNSARIALR